MSEAQYVSTGEITGQDSLSHYGLGLEKYTHFTSPIRRYADVIVHKQLLAGDSQTTNAKLPPTARTNNTTKYMNALPTSKVISILSGEGLQGGAPEDELDSTLDEREQAIVTPATTIDEGEVDESSTVVTLYEPNQVSKICDGLNRQNRMAKLSSFECQSLFLSLYFKEHTETTQAVVTNLRSNGFWVYVPRFDMRGPVYLSDMNGNVQVDPALFKLPDSVGHEPSAGFVSSGRARMFPAGKCQLIEVPEERLEVLVPESNVRLRIQILDVVTVTILSDNWDTRSRVPPPRLHLIAGGSPKSLSQNVIEKSVALNKTTAQVLTRPKFEAKKEIYPPSLYQELVRIEKPPILVDIPLRSQKDKKSTESKGCPSIAGRFVFGAFRNPDTHSAKQEVSMAEAAEAAKERRSQMMDTLARNSEFNKSSQIERDATARMQRLAAGKRNARRATAK